MGLEETQKETPEASMRKLPFLRSCAGILAGALFLAAGAPPAAQRTLLVFRTRVLAFESGLDAQRRVLGADYVDAVEAIRRSLPRDAEYLLVDSGVRTGSCSGCATTCRAARCSWAAGEHFGKGLRNRYPGIPFAVVSGRLGEPPQLLPRDEFLQWLRAEHGR